MKIMSIPQPYAGYIVAGWLPNIVIPGEHHDEDELVICADGRRTLPVRTAGGMYAPPAEPKLVKTVGVALGVVSMAGTHEPDEVGLALPYLPGRFYLAVQHPRVFSIFPDRVCGQRGRIAPVDIPEQFMRGRALMNYEFWRQLPENRLVDESAGATTPSKDGWTGD